MHSVNPNIKLYLEILPKTESSAEDPLPEQDRRLSEGDILDLDLPALVSQNIFFLREYVHYV